MKDPAIEHWQLREALNWLLIDLAIATAAAVLGLALAPILPGPGGVIMAGVAVLGVAVCVRTGCRIRRVWKRICELEEEIP